MNRLKIFFDNSDKRKIFENFLSLSFIRVADFVLPLIVLFVQIFLKNNWIGFST